MTRIDCESRRQAEAIRDRVRADGVRVSLIQNRDDWTWVVYAEATPERVRAVVPSPWRQGVILQEV